MQSALDLISWVAIGCGLLVALTAVFSVRRWRACPPGLVKLAWTLELLHVVRAVGGVGVLLAGDRPESMTTYVGYLLASVALLPLALRAVEDDESVWSAWVVAIVSVAVTVVAYRLLVTR